MTEELPGRADLVHSSCFPTRLLWLLLLAGNEGGEVNFAEVRTAIKDQPAKAKRGSEAWNS